MLTSQFSFLLIFLCLQDTITIQQSKLTIIDLAWLAGCWQGTDTTKIYREQWMKPAGRVMIGMSHTTMADTTREYEYLQIRQQSNGDIFYVAIPSGQKETSFKLTKFDGKEAVFENPEHDFPQRIIYRLENDSILVARIEGTIKGKQRSVDFPLKRVKCD
jgi:hypothetical protein